VRGAVTVRPRDGVLLAFPQPERRVGLAGDRVGGGRLPPQSLPVDGDGAPGIEPGRIVRTVVLATAGERQRSQFVRRLRLVDPRE
jgi:hypothetical protein